MSESKENNKSTTEKLNIQTDPTWKGMYRVGGICMLAFGLIYIIATTLNLTLAVPPNDSIAFLNSLSGHATLARVIYGLYSLSAFLLLPAATALYLSLKMINKNAMLVAPGLLFLFIVLDLALTEFNSLTLVTLTQHYANATIDAQRLAYMAAIDYALATIPIATFYSWVVGSLGFLITSMVMLNGVFGKRTAYYGIIANTAGIVGGFYIFFPILTIFLTPILIFWGIWLLVLGFRLYNLTNP
ncbi:MAG: hypothetical protein ACXVZU_05315 [Methanobacteriaceae archaeon]